MTTNTVQSLAEQSLASDDPFDGVELQRAGYTATLTVVV